MNQKQIFPYGWFLIAGLISSLSFNFFSSITPLFFILGTSFFYFKINKQKAFFCALTFFLAQHMSSLSWVTNALKFSAETKDLRLLVNFFLPLAVAFCSSCGFLLFKFFHPKKEPHKALFFIISWLIGEFIRQYVVNFPWNSAGQIFIETNFLQLASLTNVHFLTIIALLFSIALVQLIEKQLKIASIFCSSLLICWVFSNHLASLSHQNHEQASAAIVQANIAQSEKWHPNATYHNLAKHVNMSNDANAEFVFWPESAITLDFSSNFFKQNYLQHVKSKFLIAGGTRFGNDGKMYNSILVFKPKTQELIAHYDKQILVPFGEFTPFKKFLPINKITAGKRDFHPGSKTQGTIKIDDTNFIPQICFESAFPLFSRKKGVLLNLTNDSWFEDTMGPRQHLNHFRMRVVENRSFGIRAAGTGISAIISPKGEILQSTNLLQEQILKFNIPSSGRPLELP